MRDAPERIWSWQDTDPCADQERVEYVRADLVDAKDARIAELEAEVKEIRLAAKRQFVTQGGLSKVLREAEGEQNDD